MLDVEGIAFVGKAMQMQLVESDDIPRYEPMPLDAITRRGDLSPMIAGSGRA